MFNAMLELVNSENIMALTYNPVLGALWRLVMTQRDDYRYSELKRAMGDSIRESKDDPERAQILHDWHEASYVLFEREAPQLTHVPCKINCKIMLHSNTINRYDHTEEIESILRKVKFNDENEYFTLNVSNSNEHMPSLKELRSIAQCPARNVLSKVQHLLSHVSIFRMPSSKVNDAKKKDDTSMRYLPCALSDKHLFELLPSLIYYGM